MLRRACLALVAGAVLAAAPATAQAPEAPASAVLTLDQERLFTESRFGQRVLARHDEARRALLAENQALEAQLEAEERDLTARRPGLAPSEFRSLADAFDVRAEDIRTRQGAKEQVLRQELNAEQQRFFAAAGPVLEQLLRDRGASVILVPQAILIAVAPIDITDAAIARLDEVLGDGLAPVNAPGD
jgi:Skp family chaperone for outer membrane proteins